MNNETKDDNVRPTNKKCMVNKYLAYYKHCTVRYDDINIYICS